MSDQPNADTTHPEPAPVLAPATTSPSGDSAMRPDGPSLGAGAGRAAVEIGEDPSSDAGRPGASHRGAAFTGRRGSESGRWPCSGWL